ncbi:DUF6596 domain-containing protein [Gordonia soli]|uniref:Putative RNA polymerase ECF-type sigma factor n=1 Tax=Gordonia soli NBRC 108243 TaxID=1223545 RepID=M0QK49_9ACTN|nr:DUF6596 domain-containing protein [Gordonia soli]GAC68824.1 putative RNA polymerase ECF-type sigma factor [Gordonia soli NBRC 108243]
MGDGAGPSGSGITPEAFVAAWPSVVRALLTITGSADDAEEFAAEAFARAAEQSEPPVSLCAWCVAAGRRAWIDTVRRRVVAERVTEQIARSAVDPGGVDLTDPGSGGVDDADPGDAGWGPGIDDRIALMFVACDDELTEGARLVLALRLVCGLRTADIARLLGIEPATAAARLTRAKRTLASARPGFRLADRSQRRLRLPTVLDCLSLMFTHGHRVDFVPRDALTDTASAALGIVDDLVGMYPDDTEVRGLRAVMRLGLARRAGRVDDGGAAVPACEVDRTRWDRRMVAAGLDDASRAATAPGRFALEAAIAGLHCSPAEFDRIDWAAMVTLYRALEAVWPSPAVVVARAVAVSYATGTDAMLESELTDIVESGPAYAARDAALALADIEWRDGRTADARQRYHDLAESTLPDPVLRFCRRRSGSARGEGRGVTRSA